MSDHHLNAALADDLDGAFEALVLAFQQRIYRFALRYCGGREDAEEIAQDAFVRAYRALRDYSPAQRRELALRPWLYTIALNVARNKFRRKQLHPLSLDGPASANGALEIADPHAGRQPLAVAEQRETGQELSEAIAMLPVRYRAAVILRHVEGLSYAEVAQTLDQPVGTAKANVHRGIRLLRESLESAAPAPERTTP